MLLRCPVLHVTTQTRRVFLYSKAYYNEINNQIKKIDWEKEH